MAQPVLMVQVFANPIQRSVPNQYSGPHFPIHFYPPESLVQDMYQDCWGYIHDLVVPATQMVAADCNRMHLEEEKYFVHSIAQKVTETIFEVVVTGSNQQLVHQWVIH